MDSPSSTVIRSSGRELTGPDIVRANDRRPDERTARRGEQTIRVTCPTCLRRFEVDPELHLIDHEWNDSSEDQDPSPSSEWTCY